MQTETLYKIRNWPEYNRALTQRGGVNVWVEEESLKKWYSSSHTCLAGRPETSSGHAVLMLLTLREVFKLTLRSLQVFVKSLFKLIGLDLLVPCYTQISRRAQTLHIVRRPIATGLLVIDDSCCTALFLPAQLQCSAACCTWRYDLSEIAILF